MSKNDVEFINAIESRTRGILVDLLRESPDRTVRDLQQLVRGEYGSVLATITLGELSGGATTEAAPKAAGRKAPVAKAQGKAPAAPKAKATKAAAKASAPKAGKGKAAAKPAAEAAPPEGAKQAAPASVDVRTPAGRQAFDEAVFGAVQSIGGSVGAGQIQKITGGTNMQVRSACNRLIEAGRLSWSGKARGTRYFVA